MEPTSHTTPLATTALHDSSFAADSLGVSEWLEQRWLEERSLNESISEQLYDAFDCSRATPEMMDAYWADGWRHFGTSFFRTQIDILRGELVLVMPLRIVVDNFTLSKSQRRIWRKNADAEVNIHPIQLTEAHSALFDKHKQRFTENQPETLHDFLSTEPATAPCLAYECRITDQANKRLLAASFVDIGDEALSSVYAMFDPEEAQRSLGIFTLLCELDFAKRLGKKYLYLGYAYHVPSFYDYKKQFSAIEYYDWRGAWLPLSR